MSKWHGLDQPITAEAAEAEPEHLRLFGPSYEARQRQRGAQRPDTRINRKTYRPWRKPQIERPAARTR